MDRTRAVKVRLASQVTNTSILAGADCGSIMEPRITHEKLMEPSVIFGCPHLDGKKRPPKPATHHGSEYSNGLPSKRTQCNDGQEHSPKFQQCEPCLVTWELRAEV